MSAHEIKRYDPAQRAIAKQASRDADADSLAQGKRAELRLHRENGLLAFPRQGLSVDFASFIDPRP